MNYYDIVSLLIDSIATFATVAAVFVALWQTKYPYKKKIILSNTVIVQMKQFSNSISNRADYCLRIDIQNQGRCDVELSEYGLYISNDYQLQAFNLDNDSKKELSPGKHTSYTLSYKGICKSLKDDPEAKNRANENLKLYVRDSSGKLYYTKTKKKIDFFLNLKENEQYINIE